MEGELQITFGRNLRAYREHLGMTQEAFAEQLHFHRTYMGGVERGERNVTLKSAERIADRLGMKAYDLLAEDFRAAEANPKRGGISRQARPAKPRSRPKSR